MATLDARMEACSGWDAEEVGREHRFERQGRTAWERRMRAVQVWRTAMRLCHPTVKLSI
jgi:hypothetical protein